tara:strand:+ start:59 stop:520 length:462 start_codon:yes stop_codon:yes gene_type:complete
MKVLLVEDQQEKSEDVLSLLGAIFKENVDVSVKQSLRSGLKELISSDDFQIVILDMSMPNYDPGPEDPVGGTPESFAGREFLAQMKLRDITTPVVVVTQYSTFAKGQIDLEDLDFFFRRSYPGFYKGSVYYSSADKTWKSQLESIVKELFDEL